MPANSNVFAVNPERFADIKNGKKKLIVVPVKYEFDHHHEIVIADSSKWIKNDISGERFLLKSDCLIRKTLKHYQKKIRNLTKFESTMAGYNSTDEFQSAIILASGNTVNLDDEVTVIIFRVI